MKRITAQTVSIFISDVKPLDARFVQMVCDYLDRVLNDITCKPEPRHQRFLFARRPRISNTEAQAVSAAFATRKGDISILPRWVRDSVILWHRELAKAEVIERGPTAPQKRVSASIRPPAN